MSSDNHSTGTIPANRGAAEQPPMAVVRYGKMGHVGEFGYPPNMPLRRRSMVVISTERGIELGETLCLAGPGGESAVAAENIRVYAQNSGSEACRPLCGRVLRAATEADLNEYRHIEVSTANKLDVCRQMAAEIGLDIKVVDCEHVLGGERIVFYFMAEQRVDFRELVRQLAGEFQTRIEMRQIGARDEARLLADYETCGRQCCCKNFLKTLKPITMSMAKLQKTTLDLAKVSGRCGRLKCCLRYEYETYEELNQRLPRNGVRVASSQGTGKVVDRQILCQLLKVQTDDGRLIAVPIEDVRPADAPPAPLATAGENEERRRTVPLREAVAPAGPAAEESPETDLIEDEEELPAVEEDLSPEEAADQPDGPSPAEPAEPTEPAPQSPRRRRRGRRGRRNRHRDEPTSPPGPGSEG